MKKFAIIIIILIMHFSYYGAVNEKGERINSLDNIRDNNEIQNEVSKDTNAEE